MEIAKRAASCLSSVPTILFIGISGGLSVADVRDEDDIDFFIITTKNSLFKTRFLILLLLEKLGLRRKRAVKRSKDKICVNFLIDSTKLAFAKERQDIYTGREIVQLQPLFDRNRTYQKFLAANKWTKNYFPNASMRSVFESHHESSKWHKIFAFSLHYLFPEWVFRVSQTAFINTHKTSETVGKSLLLFNPHDYRVQTLRRLRLKLQELGLLTKI